MNNICAKEVMSFGRKIMSVHIDDTPIDKLICELLSDSSFLDLWCAWLLNDDSNDSRYIWTLLNEKRDCNLPILLCPDDMDFWCTTILAQVRFSAEQVFWNKIGVMTEKIDVIKWRESGMQNIASWSDIDRDKYGDELSSLEPNDKAWEQWWSEHWPDEENRRIWNYIDPYFNDDKNIEWLDCPAFTFKMDEYDACVSVFKNFQLLD